MIFRRGRDEPPLPVRFLTGGFMFYQKGLFSSSDLLSIPGVVHGFSAREGGYSTLSHTASFNLSYHLGDGEDVVQKNIDLFARSLTDGLLGGGSTATAHQIHSAKIRYLTCHNCGEGYHAPCGEDCDGFVTDVAGILPIVRTADCVPILLAGIKEDRSPVIAAVHAGWRGTVAGIAACAVEEMVRLGCQRSSVRCAIGPHIGACCFEVKEDFFAAVEKERGSAFARRHVTAINGGSLHADLTAMNLEILREAGIPTEAVDCSSACTACHPDRYYSHRATGGKRGTMGAGIVILPQN